MNDVLRAAFSAGIPIGATLLVAVIIIGSLYHRVLSLPADRRDHGHAVLASLTELVRVLRGGGRRARQVIDPARGSSDESGDER